MYNRLPLFWNTVLNMEPGQLVARIARRLRYHWLYPLAATRLFPLSTFAENKATLNPVNAFHEDVAAFLAPDEWLLQEAAALCQHRFSFINLPAVDLGTPVNWHAAPENDRLWQYNLHYGEWALILAYAFLIEHDTRFQSALIGLLDDWLDHNPICSSPGWEPYPLSRRLVIWTRLGNILTGNSWWRTFWQTRLLPSLYQQAQVLAANLEHDMADNHLIANYRALAWLGMHFPQWPEAHRWRAMGLNGLRAEMRRQVLSDGVHDERSISYHTIVLQDLLETWWLALQTGRSLNADMQETITKMVGFLADTQAPDGTWPMVNDSVPGYPVDPRSVLLAAGVLFEQGQWIEQAQDVESAYPAWFTGQLASPDPRTTYTDGKAYGATVFPEAGYAVIQDASKNYLFFDAGPMSPGRIPGHGHADTLSIVLHGKGQPLIVDPGVYTYRAGTWRDRFRSTAVHNTITVDGQDQCVFWGPFRAAYLPRARLTEWADLYVAGMHEGYSRLPQPVVHHRRVEHQGLGVWEIQDRLEGQGAHEFVLTFQFAVDAQAACDGLNAEIRWPNGVRLSLKCLTPPQQALARIEPGWVSPGWNLIREAPRYVLRWRAKVPVENRILLEVSD